MGSGEYDAVQLFLRCLDSSVDFGLQSIAVEQRHASKPILRGCVDPDTEQREKAKAYNTLYSYADQFVRSGDVAEVELVMGTDLDKFRQQL